MTRLDLLALTPEAVAALTNMGLVRRARREIDAGQGPQLEESADGTLTGRFPDGVATTFAPGVAIGAAVCTCGATGVCRHRVAVALAYRAWHDAHAGAPPSASVAPWSPGEIGDAALQAALGKRVLGRARELRTHGCDIEVRRGAGPRPPEARLQTCTVQFLVPRNLAYARCDCATGQGCEHVALAVWAFRDADTRDPAGEHVTVHLLPDAPGAIAADPLAETLTFSREVLLQGVSNVTPAIAGRLARARASLDAARMTWPGTILDEVEDQLQAYRDHSARYSAATVARLLGEAAARVAAVERGGDLPPHHVLGIGEARETALGHVRLLSLGARVFGAGRERWADIYLADTAAGVVLVLSKAWDYSKERTRDPDDGAALASRQVLSGISLGSLASGQLVTRAGKRSANRAFRLGSPRRDMVSVTAQAGDWGVLPDGIVIRDLASHLTMLKTRPPRWLRPRVLAESTHVVEIAAVEDVIYAPGAQTLVALITDTRGHALRLALRYRSVAPYALEALAAALRGTPGPRFVSGPVYIEDRGLEMAPVAVVTDRVVVLDLEPATSASVALGEIDLDDTPLSSAVSDAWRCLADGAHAGLLRPSPAWLDRVARAAERAEQVGLHAIARSLTRVADATRRGSTGLPSNADTLAAALTWERAAIRVTLTRERL